MHSKVELEGRLVTHKEDQEQVVGSREQIVHSEIDQK